MHGRCLHELLRVNNILNQKALHLIRKEGCLESLSHRMTWQTTCQQQEEQIQSEKKKGMVRMKGQGTPLTSDLRMPRR